MSINDDLEVLIMCSFLGHGYMYKHFGDNYKGSEAVYLDC